MLQSFIFSSTGLIVLMIPIGSVTKISFIGSPCIKPIIAKVFAESVVIVVGIVRFPPN
ncbi:hypothetical protein D3C87_1492270 [compost metagenome]